MVPIRTRRRNARGVWLSSFCVVLGCLVIPACSDDPVLPLPQDTQVESSWSIDTSHEVFGDIGASGQNAFTVGSTGTYKYDGVVWERITTGAPGRIVVTASGKVYGVNSFQVLRLDDTVWDSMLEIKSLYARPDPYLRLSDVWADDSGEVFAVGSSYFVGGNAYRTAVYHFDGTTWKEIGPFSGGSMYAVWGSSPTDVFMGGSGGNIFHYDGAGWTLVDTVTSYAIRGIWGRSGSDVFAVGDEGTILHYDGSAWSHMASDTTMALLGINGLPGGDVYAWGKRGMYLRYDGTAWAIVSIGAKENLTGLWGPSPDNLFAISDGGMLNYNGSGWRRLRGGPRLGWEGVWMSPGGEAFAVGEWGVIERRDSSGWHPMIRGAWDDLWSDVWGTSATDVYVVGMKGKISHFDGNRWEPMNSSLGTGTHLYGVWGWGERLFAVGTYAILEFDGTSWARTSGDIPNVIFRDVWGDAVDDVFVVGNSGTILHYDGTGWTVMKTEEQADLYGIWGSSATDVFAVGEEANFFGSTRYRAATIMHFDGQTWTRMESEGIPRMHAVWGNSANDIFAVGSTTVAHFDGSVWGFERFSGLPRMKGLHGLAGQDMFAVGGGIFFYGRQR